MCCRVLGARGPLWLRPHCEGPEGLPPGITQVAGHTPPDGRVVQELRDAGLHLIDPGVPQAWEAIALPPCRYAVVTAGVVAVLQEDCVPNLAA
jgi:hypothetical protein